MDAREREREGEKFTYHCACQKNDDTFAEKTYTIIILLLMPLLDAFWKVFFLVGQIHVQKIIWQVINSSLLLLSLSLLFLLLICSPSKWNAVHFEHLVWHTWSLVALKTSFDITYPNPRIGIHPIAHRHFSILTRSTLYSLPFYLVVVVVVIML